MRILAHGIVAPGRQCVGSTVSEAVAQAQEGYQLDELTEIREREQQEVALICTGVDDIDGEEQLQQINAATQALTSSGCSTW
eukprot:661489-Amphidinium_carterae.2